MRPSTVLASTASKLVTNETGCLGILQLNRPTAFHALDIEMIYSMQSILKDWYRSDNEIQAFIMKSSETKKRKTFCSGGDVKSIALDCKNNIYMEHGQGRDGVISADFFRNEYYVNHALAKAPKIQISLWDGLVFGGGVGVSLFGKYRVATEHTLFSMPETLIGFFPDVGALYQMPKIMPSKAMVSFLALTGHRLTAPDLLYSGLATHYVPSDELENLTEALEIVLSPENKKRGTGDAIIAPVLESFDRPPKEGPPVDSFLAKNAFAIEKVFGNLDQTLEESLKALDDGSEFGIETMETLNKMSPTALKITWELLRRGRSIESLEDHLVLEYRLSQNLMKLGSDFHEGVRAALLDKSKNKKPPQWNPGSLAQVSDNHIRQYYFEQPIAVEWNAQDSPIFSDYHESKL